MNDINIYIRKQNSMSNKKLNIKEKNNEIENFVGNYIKNKPNIENYIKKNSCYSRLISDTKALYKTKTTSNNIKEEHKNKSFSSNLKNNKTNHNSSIINSIENSKNSVDKNLNININNKKPHCFTKHSSLKYFKVSPIINPIYNRTYFTPKTNVLKTNNNINIKTNLNLDNIIQKIKINEDDAGTSTSDRQTQSLNKIENMPIHIMNNINIINNNLINKENKKIKNEKKLVFKKKRIPSCGKKSFSKPKNESHTNNENKNINKVNDKNTNNNIKYKNKKIKNIQFDETIYIKNNNNDFANYNSHKLDDNKIFKMKNKNMFNRPSIKQIKTKKEEIHKNFFIDIRNNLKKDHNKSDNNSNNSNTNIYEQTKIAFKELNLEDFLLIIQKFDDIRNNINYLNSFTSKNINSNNNILEIIHINRIKLYDLYKFYMGSSFDGSPEKLFSSKKSKTYFHFYTIIFIISIATLYMISENIEFIQDFFHEIIKLINLQEKIFLLFCDIIIQKLNKKYKDNLWVTQILDILSNKLIINVNNHITQIKNLSLDSYEIINNLLLSISNFNNKQNSNAYKYQEKYLYNNFYKKNIEYFTEIEINQIEDDFNNIIFKANNLRNSNSNISSFKRNITMNNFKQINLYSKNNNIYKNFSYVNINKTKKNSFNKIYNNTNISTNYNTSNENNNISIIKNTNSKIYNLNKNNQLKNSSKSNPYIFNYSSSIQQFDIKIPDTDIIIPPITIPFLNFHTNKKYTLIIDLDETMVNFKFVNIKKGIGKLFIRPYLENFLEVIKDYFEIISFTSATRDYADIVLDIIEKNKRKKYFDARLYREHTTKFGKKYIKDLSKMGRDLGKIIIVDNLSQCFKLHSDNGILISSFYGEDENDKALIELQKILIKIYYENCDVRISISKFKDDIFNKISKSQMNYS